MSSYTTRKSLGQTDWFVHDRFGMFIHFGLYSLPARHEWVKSREKMSDEAYDRYFQHFNPDLYDAAEWAQAAKRAGMKYAVLTTKHHEGFCLFDSRYTDYKSTNTQIGRDLVKEYVEAFRAAGLKVGLYYSLIDWHHPEFPIDVFHPRRDDEGTREMNQQRDMRKYAEYMRNQVAELLTNYGKIDIIWFDYSYTEEKGPEGKSWLRGKGKDDWEAEKLIRLVRELQPHIIINNRTDIDQDIWTPEQYQPVGWMRHKETGELVTWEACQTFSGSWGYARDELTWKSPEMLIRMLVKTVACGGNMIMNVGPTARGDFSGKTKEALDVFGGWMKYHARSIYGCTMAEPEFQTPDGCCLTQSQDGKRLYIHILDYPFAQLWMGQMAGKIRYAQFLHDGSEVLWENPQSDLHIGNPDNLPENPVVFRLPVTKPDPLVPVIEIFLN